MVFFFFFFFLILMMLMVLRKYLPFSGFVCTHYSKLLRIYGTIEPAALWNNAEESRNSTPAVLR